MILKVILSSLFFIVCTIYLVIQCYKDIKEILKNDHDTFKD